MTLAVSALLGHSSLMSPKGGNLEKPEHRSRMNDLLSCTHSMKGRAGLRASPSCSQGWPTALA